MITACLWFASCSVACLLGYVVGRCFQDFAGIAATQDLIYYENDNGQLREALHHAVKSMKQMQADLEAVGGKSKEADYVAQEAS